MAYLNIMVYILERKHLNISKLVKILGAQIGEKERRNF